jgi:excisionase family DNA binding protein
MSNSLIPIGEAAKQLGISKDTLRRWDATHRLPSIRSGPRGNRFYRQDDINLFLRDESSLAKEWAMAIAGLTPSSDVYCQTRDIFQARLEKLQHTLQSKVSESAVSLLCAVVGEIGNNSFDHNLGNWPDVTGIYFSHDLRNKKIVLADRGLGILATLKRVRPSLNSASEALKVAFTETISGRLPEARGNGLKFVRSVVVDNPFTLKFQTGDASLVLKEYDRDIEVSQTEEIIRGCLAIIGFENTI